MSWERLKRKKAAREGLAVASRALASDHTPEAWPTGVAVAVAATCRAEFPPVLLHAGSEAVVGVPLEQVPGIAPFLADLRRMA